MSEDRCEFGASDTFGSKHARVACEIKATWPGGAERVAEYAHARRDEVVKENLKF